VFEAGHASFMVGTDMSYFENVLDLVNQYNAVVYEVDNKTERDHNQDHFD